MLLLHVSCDVIHNYTPYNYNINPLMTSSVWANTYSFLMTECYDLECCMDLMGELEPVILAWEL